MAFTVKKAERTQKKLKMFLGGPSGSGKTMTALAIANGLTNGGRVFVADTEENSSSMYADEFDFDCAADVSDTSIDTYIEFIKYAEDNKYDCLIIDSLSHAWLTTLDKSQQIQKRDKSVNSFTVWNDLTPELRKLLEAIVKAKVHIIATCRTKTEYVMKEYEDRSGRTRTKPEKVGTVPIFRKDHEYEFDVVATLNLEHDLIVEKTRIKTLDGRIVNKAGAALGKEMAEWLAGGKKEVEVDDPAEWKIESTQSKNRGMSLSEIEGKNNGWVDRVVALDSVKGLYTKKDLEYITRYHKKLVEARTDC